MEATCPLSHLESSSVRQWPWAGWFQLHPLHHPELGVTQQAALSLPGTLSLTLRLFVSLVMTEVLPYWCSCVWPLWTKQLDFHLISPCFNFPTWSLCKNLLLPGHLLPWFFFPSYYFRHSVSCSPDWPRTHYVAEDGFGFLISLPLPLNDWDYRHVPPYPVSAVFESSRGLPAC